MSSDGIGRLTQMLELNEFKLNSLLEITKGINHNLSIPNILKIYEYIIRNNLGLVSYCFTLMIKKIGNASFIWSKGLNKKLK